MKNKENIDFENAIREKLNAFEYEYNPSSWEKFRKNIPGKTLSPLLVAIIISGLILVGTAVYFIIDSEKGVSNWSNDNVSEVIKFDEKDISDDGDIVVENTEETENVELKIESKNIIIEEGKKSEVNDLEEEDVVKVETEEEATNNCMTEQGDPMSEKQRSCMPSAKFVTSDLTGCEPCKVSFMPQELSDSIIYMWDFGDGTFSNEKRPEHIYTSSGKYYVSLTVKYYRSEKINAYMSKELIVVNPVPDAKIQIEKQSQTKYIFKSVVPENVKSVWIIEDTKYYSEDIQYTFIEEGDYKILLITENGYGCKSEEEKMLKVLIDFDVFMPNAFSPDGDGKNDYFGPITTEKDIEEFMFYIYNRTGELVYFSDDINKPWDGIIYNSIKKAEQGIYFWDYYLKKKTGEIKEDRGKVVIK